METAHHLRDKAAKYTLGLHRGPLAPPNATGDDLEALEQVETAKTITLEKIQRTPTQKLARHWKRFWCCYLFWNVIFLAIFLPILYVLSSLLLPDTISLCPCPVPIRTSTEEDTNE